MVYTNEFKQFKTFAREHIAQGDFVWLEWNQNQTENNAVQAIRIGWGTKYCKMLKMWAL